MTDGQQPSNPRATRIGQHYRDVEASIIAQGRAAGVFDASTTIGNAREFIVNDFLRPHLPQRLDVVSGEIIDSSDNSSGQTDTILRDNQSLAWGIGGQALVPVEATTGAIEIKSSLGGDELEGSIRKVARIKRLQRGKYEGMYGASTAQTLAEVPPSRTKAYVIAYDGPKWETVFKKLADNPAWYEGDYLTYGPEVIVILGRGAVVKNDKEICVFPECDDKGIVLISDIAGLEMVGLHVNEMVSRYGGLTYGVAAYGSLGKGE